MAFDIEGAKKSGYSDAEIADYLGAQNKFDVNGARKAGYSDAEIISHFSGGQSTPVAETIEQPAAQQQTSSTSPSINMGARFVRGLMDVPRATAQMVLHAVPQAAIEKAKQIAPYSAGIPFAGPALQAAQLLPNQSAPEYDQELSKGEQAYQAARQAANPDAGIDWARMAGNIVATAPAAFAMPAAGEGLAAQTGNAFLQGGTLGTAQPIYSNEDNFVSQKAKQAGIGALTGAALTPITYGLSRVIQPQTRPEVQALLDEGITPTPGQILGGTPQRIEEKLTSIPLLGDAIKMAQRRATSEFNEAAINRSLAPIGEQLPKGVTGREAITYAGEKLGQAYDDVLTKIGAVNPDAQFATELNNLGQMTQNLPKQMGDQFQRILKNEIIDRIDNGAMTSQSLKAAESNLGEISKAYLTSPDYDKRIMSQAIAEAQTSLRSMLERQAPQYADELANINRGWANFMRPQRAAAAIGSEEGIFTAAQLQNAVKSLDSTRNKRAFAQGTALMQDLSDSAKAVLGNKYPDSGTAGRLAMGLLGLGGIGSINPVAATIGGAGMLPYTSIGQRVAATLLTQRPQIAAPIAAGLEHSIPAITAMGSVAAPQIYRQ